MRVAGWSQLALAAASTAIPFILRWPEETRKLRPLLRQLFWIYGAYILAFHVAFGLLSAGAPAWLLDGSPLATAVTGFIALYWAVRLSLQFVFDRSDVPHGTRYRLAEVALSSLFVCLTATYTAACLANLER